MAITTNNPLVIGDKTFENLAISLSFSPLWSAESVGCSVALQATPYRYNEQGQVEKPMQIGEDGPIPGSEYNFARSAVYLNVFETAQEDPDLAEAAQSISDALQKLVTAKGL